MVYGKAPERPNIVHIIIDDLRTEIGAYNPGHTVYTPNMDALANEGVLFDRAYAQQALCNPSRASFLTGRRPDATKIYNLKENWRVKNPHWTSLPGMFKNAGYRSLGCGKTYHDTIQGGMAGFMHEYDGMKSWSNEALPYDNPCWTQGVDCIPCPKTGYSISNVSEDWCAMPEGDLSDVQTVNKAIKLLKNAVKRGDPFYLAVGFHKPHMPWIAKQEHFDLYPLDSIRIAKYPTLHPSIPEIAFMDSHQSITPTEPISELQAKLARRAYYAATTGMDYELGRFLDALRDSGVMDKTAIVVHGDHGWHLGEHGAWRKNTNWEAAVRTPLLMRVPWIEGIAGTRTSLLAELVDIMPTLADLAGIPIPEDQGFPLEGVSLVPALTGSEVKNAAFSQYPRSPQSMDRPWKSNGIDHKDLKDFKFMGYTVRVDEWRYTEWLPWDQSKGDGDWNAEVFAKELYDHRSDNFTVSSDYDLLENINIITEFPGVGEELSRILRNHFIRAEYSTTE